VVEPRHGRHLPHEPFLKLGVLWLGGHHLDRHSSADLFVLRTVDDSQGTLAQYFADLEARERRAKFSGLWQAACVPQARWRLDEQAPLTSAVDISVAQRFTTNIAARFILRALAGGLASGISIPSLLEA